MNTASPEEVLQKTREWRLQLMAARGLVEGAFSLGRASTDLGWGNCAIDWRRILQEVNG